MYILKKSYVHLDLDNLISLLQYYLYFVHKRHQKINQSFASILQTIINFKYYDEVYCYFSIIFALVINSQVQFSPKKKAILNNCKKKAIFSKKS